MLKEVMNDSPEINREVPPTEPPREGNANPLNNRAQTELQPSLLQKIAERKSLAQQRKSEVEEQLEKWKRGEGPPPIAGGAPGDEDEEIGTQDDTTPQTVEPDPATAARPEESVPVDHEATAEELAASRDSSKIFEDMKSFGESLREDYEKRMREAMAAGRPDVAAHLQKEFYERLSSGKEGRLPYETVMGRISQMTINDVEDYIEERLRQIEEPNVDFDQQNTSEIQEMMGVLRSVKLKGEEDAPEDEKIGISRRKNEIVLEIVARMGYHNAIRKANTADGEQTVQAIKGVEQRHHNHILGLPGIKKAIEAITAKKGAWFRKEEGADIDANNTQQQQVIQELEEWVRSKNADKSEDEITGEIDKQKDALRANVWLNNLRMNILEEVLNDKDPGRPERSVKAAKRKALVDRIGGVSVIERAFWLKELGEIKDDKKTLEQVADLALKEHAVALKEQAVASSGGERKTREEYLKEFEESITPRAGDSHEVQISKKAARDAFIKDYEDLAKLMWEVNKPIDLAPKATVMTGESGVYDGIRWKKSELAKVQAERGWSDDEVTTLAEPEVIPLNCEYRIVDPNTGEFIIKHARIANIYDPSKLEGEEKQMFSEVQSRATFEIIRAWNKAKREFYRDNWERFDFDSKTGSFTGRGVTVMKREMGFGGYLERSSQPNKGKMWYLRRYVGNLNVDGLLRVSGRLNTVDQLSRWQSDISNVSSWLGRIDGGDKARKKLAEGEHDLLNNRMALEAPDNKGLNEFLQNLGYSSREEMEDTFPFWLEGNLTAIRKYNKEVFNFPNASAAQISAKLDSAESANQINTKEKSHIEGDVLGPWLWRKLLIFGSKSDLLGGLIALITGTFKQGFQLPR